MVEVSRRGDRRNLGSRPSDRLSDSGLGQVSEIFEGDEPHRPVGCIAQAWSVAELLRATVEDVYDVRPEARTSPVLEALPV